MDCLLALTSCHSLYGERQEVGHFPSIPCSAIAGFLWHLEKFGKFKKIFGEFIYCFLACQGAGVRKKKEGSGVVTEVAKWGQETRSEARRSVQEGVGLPRGAPQLVWLSSEVLERTNTNSLSSHYRPAPYYPAPSSWHLCSSPAA